MIPGVQTDQLAVTPRTSPTAAVDAGTLVRAVALATFVGGAGGVATAHAQGWLPNSLSPLANSATIWSLVALLVAATARRRSTAVAAAAVTLWSLEAGYVLGSAMKGNPSAPSTVLFWLLAGAVVGPVVGLAAHALRRGSPPLAALATGSLVGVATGEGIYGLTVVGNTTSPWFWRGQIVLAVGALAVAAATRLRTWPLIGAAVGVAAAVAIAFVAVYRMDLLASFG
ncbi:hypothetical protein BH10ACT1_BH10ACT1_22180 [soil metagenome]